MKTASLNSIQSDVRADYSKKVLFNVNELPHGGHMLQEVIIPANTKQREHYHNIQTEVFYITQGECSVFINQKEFITKPGDAFVCEPKDTHYLWNKSDKDFHLIVFKINRPENDEDSVWTPLN